MRRSGILHQLQWLFGVLGRNLGSRLIGIKLEIYVKEGGKEGKIPELNSCKVLFLGNRRCLLSGVNLCQSPDKVILSLAYKIVDTKCDITYNIDRKYPRYQSMN